MGRRYDVVVGPPAHGGHCVARLPAELPAVGGTVMFVRHALPHERVTVEITEGSSGDRFLRGDAVVVHQASPHRVTPPCRYAGPGRCGGCDLQHVDLADQRRWKAEVVQEQLRRLAGLDLAVTVEPVPGDQAGLAYRTRMRYVRTPDGGLGLRRHRSRTVVPIGDCRIHAPGALVLVEGEPVPRPVSETVRGHRFTVAADGFWQAHQGAPELLVDAVLAAAGVRPGDRVLDLYCGVGLFTAFLAEAAGPAGRVVGIEGDRTAAEHAGRNLAAHPHAEVVRGRVARVLARRDRPSYDVVVLDPPREGAKREVVDGIAAAGPRTVVHVACDPAALARDLALFADRGYRLTGLRALDLFPMTHHVEVVAALTSEVS